MDCSRIFGFAGTIVSNVRVSLSSMSTQTALNAIKEGVSSLPSYCTPARGLALLALAVIWTFRDKIRSQLISCCRGVFFSYPKNPETTLEAVAKALNAQTLEGIDDCKTFEFPLKKEGGAYQGSDKLGQKFYAFTVFSKSSANECEMRIETIYKNRDGKWTVHSLSPLFFGKESGAVLSESALKMAEEACTTSVKSKSRQMIVSLIPIPAETQFSLTPITD